MNTNVYVYTCPSDCTTDHLFSTVMESLRLFKRYIIAKNPEEVVDAYVHAVTSVRPSTSYVVGNNGKILFGFLKMLPTDLADWLCALGCYRCPPRS